MIEALLDDLNTPAALARIHTLIGDVNKASGESARRHAASILRSSARLLGLLGDDDWFGRQTADVDHIFALIAERKAARAERNFARSDAIRAELEAEGITLEDRPDGTTDWHRRRVPA